MAVTSSARLAITRWSSPADPYTRAQRDADNARLDEMVAVYDQTVEADLPAAGLAGRFHLATNTSRMRYDDAATWREVLLGDYTAGGADPTKAPTVNIGAAAATDQADGDGGRLALSADDLGRPALSVRAHTGTATDAALAVLAETGPAIVRARIDGDGGIAAGRDDGGILPRSGYVTVRPTVGTERALVVDHIAGATSDLLRLNTNGTRRLTVDALGRLFLSALSDNAVPATPGGAGVIYCNTVGDLCYKAPSGTVTTIAHH